jgi:predicted HicB family RNase H-like nuclease
MIASESKNKVLYVRLPENDHAALHALADKYQMTISSYIRQVLADHLRTVREAGLDQ